MTRTAKEVSPRGRVHMPDVPFQRFYYVPLEVARSLVPDLHPDTRKVYFVVDTRDTTPQEGKLYAVDGKDGVTFTRCPFSEVLGRVIYRQVRIDFGDS